MFSAKAPQVTLPRSTALTAIGAAACCCLACGDSSSANGDGGGAADGVIDAGVNVDAAGDAAVDAEVDAAAQSEWEQLADIPIGGAFISVGVIDGKIHAMPSGSDAHFVYDPALDSWETLAAVPEPAHHHEGAAAGSKLYRFGGYWGSASQAGYKDYNFVYDPGLGTWDTAAPMTVPRPYGTAAVIDDKIYVIGGPNIGGEQYHLMNEEYDTGGDLWTPKASMPGSIVWSNYGALVAVDGALYKFGGGGWSAPLATALKYDPLADEWTDLTPMPVANHGVAGAAIGDNVYLIGGLAGAGVTDEVLIYSVTDDAYYEGPTLPSPWQYHVAAAVDNCVYVIGGTNDLGTDDTLVLRYCE